MIRTGSEAYNTSSIRIEAPEPSLADGTIKKPRPHWLPGFPSRTEEGRQRAKLRGVKFERKPALTAYQVEEALKRREAGETLMDIARSMNLNHSTISRIKIYVEKTTSV
jgi:hypothetical protein